MTEITVGPLAGLPPGAMTIVGEGPLRVGVFNCQGTLHAIEDKCTHDDGPLCEGVWDAESCTVTCPRHGASFDLATGEALSLPAYLPARTFPVRISDGVVSIELD